MIIKVQHLVCGLKTLSNIMMELKKAPSEHYNLIQDWKTNGIIQSERVGDIMEQIDNEGFYDIALKDTARILEVIKDVVKEGSYVLFINEACSWYTMFCTAVMVGDTGSVRIIHNNESYSKNFRVCMPQFIARRIKHYLKNDVTGYAVGQKYDFIVGCLPLPVPDHVMDRLNNNGILMVGDYNTSSIVSFGKHPSFIAARISVEDASNEISNKFWRWLADESAELLEVLRRSHEEEMQAERKVAQVVEDTPAVVKPAPAVVKPAQKASSLVTSKTTKTPATETTTSDATQSATPFTQTTTSVVTQSATPITQTATSVVTPSAAPVIQLHQLLQSDKRLSQQPDTVTAPKCPVCMKQLTPPTVVCSKGHPVCYRCRTLISKCPTCKTKRFIMSNLAMDQWLDSINLK